MISLRKHIENYRGRPLPSETAAPEPFVSEFRALLLAVGESGSRAVPNLGIDLDRKMAAIGEGLEEGLAEPAATDLLAKTNERAKAELAQWSDLAASRHNDIQRELREIVSAVAAAAESVSTRDKRYAREIGDLTSRLGVIAQQNDLVVMRQSIVESTRALQSCVERMAEDSKASVQILTNQVADYRMRLEVAERNSLTDALTGLANRRAFEKHLEARIKLGRPFCLMMVDLDRFKEINDHLGHLAGDDLLRQFATELKSQFTPADMVSRLGGDEFVVIMAAGPGDAGDKVELVRKWVLGEYKLTSGDRVVKTMIGASIGIAVWTGKESGLALLARADQEVYKAKRAHVRDPK
ncbi:MAG TPA: GGDEF domain-containing protein [Bryobacteraceae bacterium]|jgi:diguanylate cyclase (GGDEF)-like protein|nr:GGDEF domain-containing protein [Bryobacteraceae bacterium]